MLGNFEAFGFISVGTGWQRYMGGTPTEIAEDGSFAGILGSVSSSAASGIPPEKGQDDFESFIEAFEIDVTKKFGERAKLRSDILFGRIASGAWVEGAGITVEQAYAAVTLSKAHNVELIFGRFGTPLGFEPFEPFNNDTISWSIASRSRVYPLIVTGAQLSAPITDNLDFFIAVANTLTTDTLIKTNDVPSGYATFRFTWGEESRQSSLAISPFIGAESDSNRHISFGADIFIVAWLTNNLLLGLEGDFRRDNGYGGPDTNYAIGLLDLRLNISDSSYGVIKYAYANQFEDGNGVLNLTGTKQQIHEISLGSGILITDYMKFKVESRFDIIVPAASKTQWVPGMAIGLEGAY